MHGDRKVIIDGKSSHDSPACTGWVGSTAAEAANRVCPNTDTEAKSGSVNATCKKVVQVESWQHDWCRCCVIHGWKASLQEQCDRTQWSTRTFFAHRVQLDAESNPVIYTHFMGYTFTCGCKFVARLLVVHCVSRIL